MKLTTYNVGNKPDEQVGVDLVELTKREPYLIGLNEVGDREAVLRRVSERTGYMLVRDESERSSGHIAALVSPHVRFEGHKLRHVSPATKVGKNTAGARNDGIAEPKYLLATRFTVPTTREKWVVGVIHLVPSAMRKGNTRTRALHALQVGVLMAWLRTRRRNAALIGDWNAEPDHWLLKVARRVAVFYGDASHGKRSIDLMATTKKMAKRIKFQATALSAT